MRWSHGAAGGRRHWHTLVARSGSSGMLLGIRCHRSMTGTQNSKNHEHSSCETPVACVPGRTFPLAPVPRRTPTTPFRMSGESGNKRKKKVLSSSKCVPARNTNQTQSRIKGGLRESRAPAPHREGRREGRRPIDADPQTFRRPIQNPIPSFQRRQARRVPCSEGRRVAMRVRRTFSVALGNWTMSACRPINARMSTRLRAGWLSAQNVVSYALHTHVVATNRGPMGELGQELYYSNIPTRGGMLVQIQLQDASISGPVCGRRRTRQARRYGG